MNLGMISGHICNDLKPAKYTDGTPYVYMTLATPKNYKVAEGKPNADFIPCLVRGEHNVTFLTKFFGKGSPILVEGSLNSYQDDEKKNIVQLLVDRLEFAPSTGKKDAEDPNKSPL